MYVMYQKLCQVEFKILKNHFFSKVYSPFMVIGLEIVKGIKLI